MNTSKAFCLATEKALKRVGVPVTFVSFISQGEEDVLNVKIRNKYGGRDNVTFNLECDKESVSEAELRFVVRTIFSGGYDKENKQAKGVENGHKESSK